MILVIRTVSGKGKKLEVIMSDDKNIVVENGNYSIENEDTDKLLITPSLVQKVIESKQQKVTQADPYNKSWLSSKYPPSNVFLKKCSRANHTI